MEQYVVRVRKHIASIAKTLARDEKRKLSAWKTAGRQQLRQPDFLWYSLLQSFSTMGRASGWSGLIGNKNNYNRVRYQNLVRLPVKARTLQVVETCHAAKVRMPDLKARYILRCFDQVKELGGPRAATRQLLLQAGPEGKIRFLKSFYGIGDKYARNIMMDVYHSDFRNSIAVDARIKSVSKAWGLSFTGYDDHERFYLSVAAAAGLSGWELDRLIFNFQNKFMPGKMAGCSLKGRYKATKSTY